MNYYKINRNCYNFKEINFKEGSMDFFIDAIYILTMSNSKRIKSVIEQIFTYKPCKKIYILFNHGFKKCSKKLIEYKSNHDILDANLQIFTHAYNKNYNNILVLEDDFIFSKKLFNYDILNNINNFISDNTDNIYCYSLGSLPMFPHLIMSDHYRIFGGGAHSIIYPKQTINHVLNFINKLYHDKKFIDFDILTFINIKRYNYKLPLVAQLYPITENKSNWPGAPLSSYLFDKYCKVFNVDLINRDTIFENYNKINRIGRNIYLVVIFIILIIIIYSNIK